MPTPVPLVSSGFNPLGSPNPFARRPDPLLALLGALSGAALGQAASPALAGSQRLTDDGLRLGPAVDVQPPSQIARLRERAATLATEGEALAATGQIIAEADRPAETDLLDARQRASSLARTYNDALNLVSSAPLVLKSELGDSLQATVSARESELSAVGITIGSDGTLSVDESTLEAALSSSSTSLESAATAVRDLGRSLGSLGAQVGAAPAEALQYEPPPDPRSAPLRPFEPTTPAVSLTGAGVVYAYLAARDQMRVFRDLGTLGTTGNIINARA